MNSNYKIVVLIPCRSGSKSLPNKNIMSYKNLPLFVHSIKVAQELSNIISEVIFQDNPVNIEPITKIRIPVSSIFRRPKISDNFPLIGMVIVELKRYAVTTQLSSESP